MISTLACDIARTFRKLAYAKASMGHASMDSCISQQTSGGGEEHHQHAYGYAEGGGGGGELEGDGAA